MMTFLEFQNVAAEMTQEVDNAVLPRHYHSWAKIAKKEAYPASAYILEHLPKLEQQKIETLLTPFGEVTLSEITSAQRWFQNRKLPVYDTISGLYVDTYSGEQLTAFLRNAVAVFPVFESFCKNRYYIPSRDRYETFLKEIRGQYTKANYCPFRSHREFWEKDANALMLHLNRWYAISIASQSIDGGKLLSLGEAAEMMKVPVPVMYDWLQVHPEFIAEHDGIICLEPEQIHRLEEEWGNVLTAEAVVAQMTMRIPATHVRKVRQLIGTFIAEHLPTWLLPAKAFPQQRDKLYVDPSKKQEAELWITERLNQIPIWSYKELRECTKLSLRDLRKKIGEELIQAESCENGDWLLSTNERNRIVALSEILIPVDEAIAPVLAEEICSFQMDYANNRENFFCFAEDHNWWDADVYRSTDYPLHGGKLGILVSAEDASILREELRIWLLLYGKSHEGQWETLCEVYESFPKTIKLLRRRYRWLTSIGKPFIDMICLMMKNLPQELPNLTDKQVLELFDAIASEATESAKKEFVEFVKFADVLKGHIELLPTGRKIDNSAYPLESFQLMIKAMIKESEINRRGLIEKAVKDQKYADLWLYTTIHLFLPWRSTDYFWVRPPELPYDPDETLRRIGKGEFSKVDAKKVALKFIFLLELDIRNPNKTKGVRNTQCLFYNFPESEHYVLGIILAIAAAHYYKNPNESSFIKCKQIADRVSLSMFYGSDYLQACQNRNYSGHRANKALMQAVEFQGRDGKHYNAEYAYVFSAMIRSHAFGLGQMSETTDIYLRDAAFSGITPEFIAFQMFQRGICSFIVDVMMNDCFGEEYKFLPVPIKTSFLQEVGMPLMHLDNTSLLVERAMSEAAAVVEEVARGKEQMVDILNTIALGHGRGKDVSSICLCKAADQGCKCPARLNCLGCKYEIKSKAVLAQYIMHANQLKTKKCESAVEEHQREWLLSNVIDPAIKEIGFHIRQYSDEDERILYKQITREVKSHGIASKARVPELQFLPRNLKS